MARPVTGYDVLVTPPTSKTSGEKVELVETCRRYFVAPTDAFQLSTGAVGTLVAPFAGEERIGATTGTTAAFRKTEAVLLLELTI